MALGTDCVTRHQDGTLKRCFGEDLRVADCDWSYLSTLRTTREPHEPMPRLVDLLEYLAQPGQENVWVLLDIKVRHASNLYLSCVIHSAHRTPQYLLTETPHFSAL